MPQIHPSNAPNITILDDEGTLILDIDPTSIFFWGRNVMLRSGFEVHLLEEDFVTFAEGDVVRYREGGRVCFREGDGEYERECEDGGGMRGGGRKRKRDGNGNGESMVCSDRVGGMAGHSWGGGNGGGDSENEERTSVDESGESSSGTTDADSGHWISDSDSDSQESGPGNGDDSSAAMDGRPGAKKARVEVVEDEREAVQNSWGERHE